MSIVVKEQEKNRMRYDAYIASYREQSDYVWRFICGTNEFKNSQLRSIKEHLLKTRGPNSKFPISKEGFETFDRIIKSDDAAAKDATFFFTIYLEPSYYQWMIKGVPANNVKPPELTDVKLFQWFVENVLTKESEALLTGKQCQIADKKGMNISMYAQYMRTEYVVLNGLPIPPVEHRTEMR